MPTSPPVTASRVRAREAVVWVGLAMIASQLAFRAWAVLQGWFYADDFELLYAATGRPLGLGYLLSPHDTHLMPGGILLSWLVAQAGPFAWTLAALIVVALQLLADLMCLVMLFQLFGRRWWCLLPLGFYLYSTLTLTAFMWWAAAVNQIPLQLAFFLVVTCHVRYLRTRDLRTGLTGVAALVLGLAFFEKSLLILLPLTLLTVLYGAPDGRWRHRLRHAVWDHRVVWAAYAAVASAYLWWYLRVLSSAEVTRGDIDYVGLLDSMVRVSTVSAALGGPWWWSDQNPPVGQVATPDWVTFPAAAAVVILLALAVRAERSRWRPVVIGTSYLLVLWLLLARTRGASLGSFAGLELRYLADAAPVLTLCLALLVAPLHVRDHDPAVREPEGGRGLHESGRRPRFPVLAVLALLAAGAVLSNVQYARLWTADFPAKSYTRATAESARSSVAPLRVADVPVPELVQSATSYPSNLPSQMFAPLGDRLQARTAGNDLDVLGSDGRPYPAVVSGGQTSVPGPVDNCGHALRPEPVDITMTGPVPDYFWWLEVSYLSSGRGDVDLVVGDRVHRIEVRQGLHRYLLRGEGAVLPVRAGLATPGVGVCVDRVDVGALSALEPLP